MPNTFAHIMLLVWPVVVVWMFQRLPPQRALIWAILGGYMLLPQGTEFNFPLVPALNKTTIPALTAALCCVMIVRMRIAPWPESGLGKALLALLVLSPVVTTLNNADPLIFDAEEYGRMVLTGQAPEDAETVLPGMRSYDTISFVALQMLLIVPMVLARQLLASTAALREIVIALVLAGLIYSAPMLVEAVMSPQLHTSVYGFFQHDFSQAIRQGGWRPFVFMPHGLWVAFFMLMSFVAALAMLRAADIDTRLRAALVALWLAGMMVVTRSLGAQMMAVVLLPLVLVLSTRLQLGIAASIGAASVVYPLLRGLDIVPVWRFHGMVRQIDEDRAGSFAFRLYHEDMLLARAAEKPLFGWGTWGRNQIRDPLSGEITSVSDGHWVIVIGSQGWLGYIATFGLLALPLVLLWWCARRLPAQSLNPWIGPLALILAFNLLDLIPNATLIPFTWLLTGALLGHAELMRAELGARARAEAARAHSSARRGLLPTARLGGAAGPDAEPATAPRRAPTGLRPGRGSPHV